MINSGSHVTEVESKPTNEWGLTRDNPSMNNRWTSTSGQRVHFNRNEDGVKRVEGKTPSSEVKQSVDTIGASYNKTNLQKTIANDSDIGYENTTMEEDVDFLWPEENTKKSSAGADCVFFSNDYNQQTNDTNTTSTVDDNLDSVSLKLQESLRVLPETPKRPSARTKQPLRSKHRRPSKTKDVLDPRTWRPLSDTSSSELRMTSLQADDVGLWMMIAERAPLQASADNVSAIGYKSATFLSEEVVTVSSAVASVLIFWSLIGTAVCLVLRMRRRKRRRLKRHCFDDVPHVDMLDEMIRTELARGRARLNTSSSSPTYVNVAPSFGGREQTTFDSVQMMNSYNAISHNHCSGGQNVYEYFITGTGRRFVSRGDRRNPRSVYNSPNVERVSCVRLANARSFEVLKKRMDFHRSRSFNEKSAKDVVHVSQDSERASRGSDSPSKRIIHGVKLEPAGYVSMRDGPVSARGSGQEPQSSAGLPPIKTSFDKTRTPEHPTESTMLNSRRLHHHPDRGFSPYHVPQHPTTFSSVLYSASRPCQDRSHGSGNPWRGEFRGASVCTRGYPSPHHFIVGCSRGPTMPCPAVRHCSCGRGPMVPCPAVGYCSTGRGSRPVRFPKMGQSCLVGEMQRNSNNPQSRKSGGREAIEMTHCT